MEDKFDKLLGRRIISHVSIEFDDYPIDGWDHDGEEECAAEDSVDFTITFEDGPLEGRKERGSVTRGYFSLEED